MNLDDLEVSGGRVNALVAGFGSVTALAHRLLIEAGVGTEGPDGQLVVSKAGWHPLAPLLQAMKAIEAQAGKPTLYQVGLALPENAALAPAPGTGVAELLEQADISYHLNHRKGGQVMFDQATGQRLEGIGHYGHLAVGGKHLVLGLCDTPYPCDMDHGLIAGLALLAKANARVVHEVNGPCRKNGTAGCTYQIRWP